MDLEKFQRELGARNPREDKERLWPPKGKPNKVTWPRLLVGPDPDGSKSGFNSKLDTWRNSDSPKSVCIQGEPGRGKTTMMITIIDNLVEELSESTTSKLTQRVIRRTKPKPTLLSYFFCQRNDDRLNNVVAVLKGLLSQIISQCKDLGPTVDLTRHFQRYGDAGSSIFKGPNAVYVLRSILHDILEDDALLKVYFCVDALDECSLGLPQLLHTIIDLSNKASWLVTTSRADIAEDLGKSFDRLNIDSKTTSSNVSALIDSRIKDLASQKNSKYDSNAQATIKANLDQNPELSYLWVDLAFGELDLGHFQATDLPDSKNGLRPLYEKVMGKLIMQAEEAEGDHLEELLEGILRWTMISYRPLHLEELDAIMGPRNSEYSGTKRLSELVAMWDPLLTTHEDNMVYFKHQSVRDYLSPHVTAHSASTDTAGGHVINPLLVLAH